MDYPISLHILKAAPRITLSFAAYLAMSGCARMYDGSIVPEYTAERVSGGLMPRVEYRRTDVLPPSRLIEFPPAPPPPFAENPAPAVRAAPRREARTRGRPADLTQTARENASTWVRTAPGKILDWLPVEFEGFLAGSVHPDVMRPSYT